MSLAASGMLCLQPCRGQNTALSDGSPSGPKTTATDVDHTHLAGVQTFPNTYEKLFPTYMSLHFNASSRDGPLEIQLVQGDNQTVVRATDWGLENAQKAMTVAPPGYLVEVFELMGRPNITNDLILNHTTGTGLLHDLWLDHPSLQTKRFNSVDFMQACMARLSLGWTPTARVRVMQARHYWRSLWIDDRTLPAYAVWWESLSGWGDNVQKSRFDFRFEADQAASAGMTAARPVPTQDTFQPSDTAVEEDLADMAAPHLMETYQADEKTTGQAPDFANVYSIKWAEPTTNLSIHAKALQRRQVPPLTHQLAIVASNPDGTPMIATQLDEHGQVVRVTSNASPPLNADANVIRGPEGRPSDVDLAIDANAGIEQTPATGGPALGAQDLRQGGLPVPARGEEIASTRSSWVEVVFRTSDRLWSRLEPVQMGIAVQTRAVGVIAAVALIVFDYVLGGSTREIFASIALAEVLAAVFLMVILPGLPLGDLCMVSSLTFASVGQALGQQDNPYLPTRSLGGYPDPNDVRELLQWTMLGSKDANGTEKCMAKLQRPCQIGYGPYLLAAVLKIPDFAAFALLIHFNKGYPLSMDDLVRAFALSTDPAAAMAVATIHCTTTQPRVSRWGKALPPRPRCLASPYLGHVALMHRRADECV